MTNNIYALDTRPDHKGYLMLRKSDRKHNPIYEHVLIAERVLGKPLPLKAVVHHPNEIKDDNRNSNLVICPDENYHRLLHQRMRAKKACGNPSWRKCWICKQYDHSSKLQHNRPARNFSHFKCLAKYQREYYANKKLKPGL